MRTGLGTDENYFMFIHVHVCFIWVVLLAIFRAGRLGASRITDPRPSDRVAASLHTRVPFGPGAGARETTEGEA